MKIQADREIVMEAIDNNADALRYASEDILDDRDFVLAALDKEGHVLEYVSERLRGDREIVMKAVGGTADSDSSMHPKKFEVTGNSFSRQ